MQLYQSTLDSSPRPSLSVLNADALVSRSMTPIDFQTVAYGRSNHIVSATQASGGNVGFVDGHVEWRAFDEMMPYFIASKPHWYLDQQERDALGTN